MNEIWGGIDPRKVRASIVTALANKNRGNTSVVVLASSSLTIASAARTSLFTKSGLTVLLARPWMLDTQRDQLR